MQTLLTHAPLLKISAQASLLIVLVLLVQWCGGHRLPPRWRCALWLLVVLRLALPWSIPSPLSLYNLSAPVIAPYVEPSPAAGAAPDAKAPAVAKPRAAAAAILAPERDWLAWLWAAGAACVLAGAMIAHYRFHRRLTRLQPVTDEPARQLLEDCKRLMGVRTRVILLETEAIASPTLLGFIRPRLLLPAGLRAKFSPEELRHIFLHELAHLRRHDILTGWVMLGLQAVHWFNPLVWLAFHRFCADRELACDALALSRTGAGDHEAYGLTILKLVEGFGYSEAAPGAAGILENQRQITERILRIGRFRKANRGKALAITLAVVAVIAFAVLAVVTLTDAQQGHKKKHGGRGQEEWSLKERTKEAKDGNQWAVFDLWDAYYHGNHGVKPDAAKADQWLGKFVKNLWVVKFEPVGDFAPTTPQEFLAQINKFGHTQSGKTNLGVAGFFRTTKQGNKLIGSFLSNEPDELQAKLANVPGLKILSADAISATDFIAYEQSPQESLWSLEDKQKQAGAGNQWAAFELWSAYRKGGHGVETNSAEADRWLGKFVQNVWVVRFEPEGDFAPADPGEFLNRIHKFSHSGSGHNDIGMASFFRTKQQGDKLVGSFLSNRPDDLKAELAKVPGLKVLEAEQLTAGEFVEYQDSPQESLWLEPVKIKEFKGGNQWAAYDLWDAYYRGKHGLPVDAVQADKWLGEFVKNVWLVRFEPVDDFAPKTPEEFLNEIQKYGAPQSGQNGIGAAGFFRTTKQGDKLVGSFLSNFPDELKAHLSKVPGLKVTGAERITAEEFVKYDQAAQESL